MAVLYSESLNIYDLAIEMENAERYDFSVEMRGMYRGFKQAEKALGMQDVFGVFENGIWNVKEPDTLDTAAFYAAMDRAMRMADEMAGKNGSHGKDLFINGIAFGFKSTAKILGLWDSYNGSICMQIKKELSLSLSCRSSEMPQEEK